MSENIYLSGIEIKNLGGIAYFKTQLGAVNIITGNHATGKTTCLNCVRSVFEGGSDPSLVRLGCEEGEVTITFTNGYVATKVQRVDGYTLKVRTPEGGSAKRPAELLKEWAPTLSFDPLALLALPEKDQLAFLLRTLPLTFTADEVNAVIGPDQHVTGDVGLSKLNEIRQGIYDDRTQVNRDVTALQGTIEDFKKSLPADEGKDWPAEVRRIQARIGEKDTAIATAKAELELEGTHAKAKAKSAMIETTNRFREQITEHRRLIATLEAHIVSDEQAQAAYELKVDGAVQTALASETAALTTDRGAFQMELATAQAQADASTRATGIREAIATRQETAKGHISREVRLSAKLTAIDEIKALKLKSLPVPGFDIRMEGAKPVITIDGVPLRRLSQKEQIFVAVMLVAKASAKLPLILCEGAELNNGAVTDLMTVTKQVGLQTVLARWDEDGPLCVVQDIAAAVAAE